MRRLNRKILKSLLYLIIIFITLIASYFGAAFVLSRIAVKEEIDNKKEINIFILSNGLHTDIVLPIKNNLKDWSQNVKFCDTKSKDSAMKYLAFGWGDKGFYLDTPTWAQLKFTVAFKAVFGLSVSAIHTRYHKEMTLSDKCRKTSISLAQYQELVKFIEASFLKDSNGAFSFIPSDAVYGDNDAFYSACGSYSLFYTCNTWTNSALKSCGAKACLWTPFESGVLYQYQ